MPCRTGRTGRRTVTCSPGRGLGTRVKLPRLSLCYPYPTLNPYPNPAIQVEVGWMHKEVTVMGRSVMQPRLVAYQADHRGLAYTYSRLTLSPDAWTPAVLAVKVCLLLCTCSRLPLTLCCPACRRHAQVLRYQTRSLAAGFVFVSHLPALLLKSALCFSRGW